MSKQPTDWDLALIRAGFVDPRNAEKPSYNQLAHAVGVPQSTVSAIVSGRSRKPKPENVQKIADALGLDVRIVAGWVGQERTERTRYTPPAEADLLTDRQRRAVDEIIRAIAAERAGSRDEPEGLQVLRGAVPDRDDLADPTLRDGATSTRAGWAHAEPPQDDYGRAADDSGPSLLEADNARAARRGEESQDPEDWT